jgi:hypothetical protein
MSRFEEQRGMRDQIVLYDSAVACYIKKASPSLFVVLPGGLGDVLTLALCSFTVGGGSWWGW